MKFIVDRQKQLNYHPLVVYVVLSHDEYKQYASSLESFNENEMLTRGLFKFRAVERGNKYSSNLSPELTASLNRFNVILRLVDDNEGNYNYALCNLNLSQKSGEEELDLRDFVINACKQNIRLLKSRLSQISKSSAKEVGEAAMISSMIRGFNDAITTNDSHRDNASFAKSADFDSSWGEADAMSSSFDTSLCRQLPPDIIGLRDSLYGGLTSRKAKSDFKKMMAFFERRMGVAEIEESDKYAQGTVDDNKAEELKLEYLCRNKPAGERPEITIHITRILPPLRKRARMVWGVEITVDGVTTPIYLGGTDATMVYFCTLMKQKMGKWFSRDFFKHIFIDSNKNSPKHKEVLWIEKVYRTIFPGANKNFKKWYDDMKSGSCHGVSQGKGAAVRVIGKNLVHINTKACYYCSIHSQEISNDESYYYIDIPAENITLSQNLLSLVEGE